MVFISSQISLSEIYKAGHIYTGNDLAWCNLATAASKPSSHTSGAIPVFERSHRVAGSYKPVDYKPCKSTR